MPDKNATTHILMPNELVIYRRERSGIWQCRYKVADVWQGGGNSVLHNHGQFKPS